MTKRSKKSRKLEAVFRRRGGVLRTSEALALGIHPERLYSLRDEGTLTQLDRGLYTLADAPEPANPDLVIVALRVPKGVLCLLSALAFHEVTTQLPHEVNLALPRGTKTPRLRRPPLRVFRFSGASFTEGVEKHRTDGVEIHVYSAAKTVADCFKFRNKIGLDVALEALRECWRKKLVTMDGLWKYGRICRVSNVMRPYLESLDVLQAYRGMANDRRREVEALDWTEATIRDVTAAKRRGM
jgi:predicted transcriptional regulator of viral defense system